MRTWEHKETKKKVRATEWWEIADPILEEEVSKAMQDKKDEFKDRKFKIGALVQVGWLLENEHNVWLGVGPKAAESFNDLGEWKNEQAK